MSAADSSRFLTDVRTLLGDMHRPAPSRNPSAPSEGVLSPVRPAKPSHSLCANRTPAGRSHDPSLAPGQHTRGARNQFRDVALRCCETHRLATMLLPLKPPPPPPMLLVGVRWRRAHCVVGADGASEAAAGVRTYQPRGHHPLRLPRQPRPHALRQCLLRSAQPPPTRAAVAAAARQHFAHREALPYSICAYLTDLPSGREEFPCCPEICTHFGAVFGR